MYTGDMLRPGKYTLDYYLGLADRLVEFGSHIIAIKSMSGVMRPAAGRALVRAIRTKYPEIPIHMHTHDTNGTGIATMVACVEAGADIVDTAVDSLSGSTSQPAASAMVAALEDTGFDTELHLGQIKVVDEYWAQLRLMYAGFDADLRSPDPTIYQHEIPGGQYSNLMFQARQLGLGSGGGKPERLGDLARFMVDQKLSAEQILRDARSIDFPASVLDYFEGLMGQPFDGFPEPLRTDALQGRRAKLASRPGLTLPPVDFDAVARILLERSHKEHLTEYDIASYIMFPDVYLEFLAVREKFGDLSNLDTAAFLTAPELNQEVRLRIEQGKELVAKIVAIGPINSDTGKREVLFRLNGEIRSVHIRDNKATPKRSLPKASPDITGEIAAPMSGKVARVTAQEQCTVRAGEMLLTMSAMKMEVNVSATISGIVQAVTVKPGDLVEKGDLLVRVTS
ncbi:hypothetical protein F5B19DRAFT_503264 [Rostrohypoxylon terebratum]|nr:hypothetical protein F5B19DRAFT_503264 [Rostrohypoxylon terebratum]